MSSFKSNQFKYLFEDQLNPSEPIKLVVDKFYYCKLHTNCILIYYSSVVLSSIIYSISKKVIFRAEFIGIFNLKNF